MRLIREITEGIGLEAYLLTIAGTTHSWEDLDSTAWCSRSARVVAASQPRQDIVLMMQPGDWLLTSRGLWQLRLDRGLRALLVLFAGESQDDAQQL